MYEGKKHVGGLCKSRSDAFCRAWELSLPRCSLHLTLPALRCLVAPGTKVSSVLAQEPKGGGLFYLVLKLCSTGLGSANSRFTERQDHSSGSLQRVTQLMVDGKQRQKEKESLGLRNAASKDMLPMTYFLQFKFPESPERVLRAGHQVFNT